MARKAQSADQIELIETGRESGIDRDYTKESKLAIARRVAKIVEIRTTRDDGSLGAEMFKLAQILLLCGLPYSSTDHTKLSRRSRLSDGSWLHVTFTAQRDGVKMPFGADRRFLTYLFHKALQSNSRRVEWASASSYLQEMGLTTCGKNMNDLRKRFARIAGLSIVIERRGSRDTDGGVSVPVISRWNMPWMREMAKSFEFEEETTAIEPTSGERNHFFIIGEELWADIQKHNVVLPKSLWLATKGSWRQQDALLWLFYRCYCARSESMIPWDSVRQQFPQDVGNKWRVKQVFEAAIKEMKIIWPEAQARISRDGVIVDQATQTFLPEDPQMKRVLRVPLQVNGG